MELQANKQIINTQNLPLTDGKFPTTTKKPKENSLERKKMNLGSEIQEGNLNKEFGNQKFITD